MTERQKRNGDRKSLGEYDQKESISTDPLHHMISVCYVFSLLFASICFRSSTFWARILESKIGIKHIAILVSRILITCFAA